MHHIFSLLAEINMICFQRLRGIRKWKLRDDAE